MIGFHLKDFTKFLFGIGIILDKEISISQEHSDVLLIVERQVIELTFRKKCFS